MARTKADRVPRKTVGEKMTIKKVAPVKISTPKRINNSKGGKKHSGGNPYHPRDTPKWQKTITCFMNVSETTSETATSEASSSQEDQDPNVKDNIEGNGDETN